MRVLTPHRRYRILSEIQDFFGDTGPGAWFFRTCFILQPYFDETVWNFQQISGCIANDRFKGESSYLRILGFILRNNPRFFSENQARRGAARQGQRSIGAGVLRKRQPKRVRRLSALHIGIPSYMFLNCLLPLVVIATHSPVLN